MLRYIINSSRGRSLRNYLSSSPLSSFYNKSGNKEHSEEITYEDDHKLVINPNDEICPDELTVKSKKEGWKDTFGSLTGYNERRTLDEISEAEKEGEIPEHIRLDAKYRKHDPDWYGKKILKLGKKGMIYEAVQVLEKEMLVDDRVRPNKFVYNNLIGVLGRVGHTHKAFKLFNDMKKRAIIPENATYTSLFNCCSNAALVEDGLTRATKLRALMKEKNIIPNIITYQAMIKAFSHLGEVRTAFQLADEAVKNNVVLSSETYSFLMMACMSDKEAGFTLCIKLWRMMRLKMLPFNTYHYNLLLKCAKECGMGSEEMFKEILTPPQKNTSNVKLLKSSGDKCLPQSTCMTQVDKEELIDPIDEDDVLLSDHLSMKPIEDLQDKRHLENLKFPNILNPKFDIARNKGWEIHLPKDSTDRLMILGGMSGILNHIEKDKSVPNIKTFSILMEMVTDIEEQELLDLMKNYNVKPDVTLLNTLIKKRSMRKDYGSAKKVLDFMLEFELQPDIKTFGCLAMGCHNERNGMLLLEDMLKMNKLPNADICDNLIYLSKMNFRYKMRVFKFMRDHQVRPSMKLLEKLEKHVTHAKRKILEWEKGREVNPYFGSEEFRRQFELFLMNYKQWLYEMELEPEIDPATRYNQPTPREEPDE